jgi:hypothetical protein
MNSDNDEVRNCKSNSNAVWWHTMRNVSKWLCGCTINFVGYSFPRLFLVGVIW